MSVLSGPEIERLCRLTRAYRDGGEVPPAPWLDIDPFDERCVGPNSVDLHLAPDLLVYRGPVLDMRKDNPTERLTVPPEGFELRPGVLYLGSTVECVEAHGLVPWIDGRSSVGRLGLSIHATAGRADDGWKGCLTLEISVIHPVAIYPNARIAQVTFFGLQGERRPYKGKYAGSTGVVASRMWEDADR